MEHVHKRLGIIATGLAILVTVSGFAVGIAQKAPQTEVEIIKKNVAVQQEQIAGIRTQLDRIEGKLDRELERHR